MVANLGRIFYDLGEYTEALNLLSKSLESYRKRGETRWSIVTLLALARTCRDCKKPQLALRHLNEALELNETFGIFGDFDTRTDICLEIARCHLKVADVEAARAALDEAAIAAEQAPRPQTGTSISVDLVTLEKGKFELKYADSDQGRRMLERFLNHPIPEGLAFAEPPAALMLGEHSETPPHEAQRWLDGRLSWQKSLPIKLWRRRLTWPYRRF